MFDQINIESSTFNNQVIEMLNTSEGQTKFAELALPVVRAKQREISFARRILPPVNVSRADCQRSVDHDTLVKIVDIEPESKAMPLTFRGQPTDHYVNGPRYAIPFQKIASEKFSKTEEELLAYDYPITKLIQENSLKDIQFVEDATFIEHAEKAITRTGKRLPSPATAVNRAALNALFKMIDGDKLSVGCALMNVVDFDDWKALQNATDIGSPLASEMAVEGYKYETILGRRLIVTNKSEIVLPGEVWAFAEPAYLGHFFLLNDTRFWIKKEASQIFWELWENIGMGIGNIRALAKLELNVPSPLPPFGSST